MKIIEILNGHINVVLGINQELSDYRIENACKKCSVSYNEDGLFTNSCLKRNGGCSCPLPAKTSNLKASCPKKIWYNETINYDILEKFKIK